jgi:hypothetical protein
MPSSLVDPPRGALRFEAWWARLLLRDLIRRARERRS